jgi:HAD superfamily hydrolase (TIGR01493 family)
VPFKPQAFIFDAYGTLFDVHSVVQREQANIQGDLQALSQLWRQKQLESTWLRALMERYEDFWQVTEAALRFAVRRLSIDATDSQLERLMEAYLKPEAFDEARSALEALKGSPLAILSNGSPRMPATLTTRKFGRPKQRTSVVFRRNHFGGQGEDVQTVSSSLRPWARNPESSRHRDSLCFLQLMGCRRSQGVWLPGLLVQPIRSSNGRLGVCSRFYCAPAGPGR